MAETTCTEASEGVKICTTTIGYEQTTLDLIQEILATVATALIVAVLLVLLTTLLRASRAKKETP